MCQTVKANRTRLQEAAFQLYRPVLAGIAPPPRPPAANGIAGKEDGAGKEEGEEEGEIAEPAAADNGASLLASGGGVPFYRGGLVPAEPPRLVRAS